MAGLALLLGYCASPATEAAPGDGTALRIAVGESKPPYVLPQEQRGVEVELIASLLQDAGYRPQLRYLPNKRAQMMLGIGEIDAAISTQGDYVSEPYIVYQNVAITLCSTGMVLNSVADLAGKRIAAFQNAHVFLGPDFAAMASRNQDYSEPQQASINRMLYARRIDVGISDINIFKSINEQLGMEAPSSEHWCPHALFPPTYYRLAFRERGARDRFNAALREALKGDRYEALARRYHLPFMNGHPYFKPMPGG